VISTPTKSWRRKESTIHRPNKRNKRKKKKTSFKTKRKGLKQCKKGRKLLAIIKT